MSQSNTLAEELLAVESRLRTLVRGLDNEDDRISKGYQRAAKGMATRLRKSRTAGTAGADLVGKALVLAREIEDFLQRRQREWEHGRAMFALANEMDTDTGLD